MVQNYYEILRSKKGDTKEVIRTRFLDLMRVNHPDKVGDESNVINDFAGYINQAWDTLKDAAERKAYDIEYDKAMKIKDGFQHINLPPATKKELVELLNRLDPKAQQSKAGKVCKKHILVGELKSGMKVTIINMIKIPKLNHLFGKVLGVVQGLYLIDIEGMQDFKLKRENLISLVDVEISNLKNHPESNGKKGKVQDFNETSIEYTICLLDEQLQENVIKRIKIGNCILPVNACVLILQGELKGKQAEINNVDRSKMQYELKMKNQEKNELLSLSWGHVRC